MQKNQLTTNTAMRTCNRRIFALRKSSATRHTPHATCSSRGFALLELLIVLAIMVLLMGASSAFYRNFVKNVELQSVSKVLVSDLRQMRSNSMIGAGGFKWGAHIVNVGSGGKQYYELFSTPTDYNDIGKTVISTTTLSLGVAFMAPAPGTSLDVIFSKISGMSSSTSITLSSEGTLQTINVSTIGVIN